jgi:hypothetical protein
MQLEVEKRDGTPFKTNLNTLAKVIYEQLFEDDLLRDANRSDYISEFPHTRTGPYGKDAAVIVINSIYDAIEKHVEFKNE